MQFRARPTPGDGYFVGLVCAGAVEEPFGSEVDGELGAPARPPTAGEFALVSPFSRRIHLTQLLAWVRLAARCFPLRGVARVAEVHSRLRRGSSCNGAHRGSDRITSWFLSFSHPTLSDCRRSRRFCRFCEGELP